MCDGEYDFISALQGFSSDTSLDAGWFCATELSCASRGCYVDYYWCIMKTE